MQTVPPDMIRGFWRANWPTVGPRKPLTSTGALIGNAISEKCPNVGTRRQCAVHGSATRLAIRRCPAGSDRRADRPIAVALTWFPGAQGPDAGWRLVLQACRRASQPVALISV